MRGRRGVLRAAGLGGADRAAWQRPRDAVSAAALEAVAALVFAAADLIGRGRRRGVLSAAGLGGADRVWRQRPGDAVAAAARQAVAAFVFAAADLIRWRGASVAAVAVDGAGGERGLGVRQALVVAAELVLWAAVVRGRTAAIDDGGAEHRRGKFVRQTSGSAAELAFRAAVVADEIYMHACGVGERDTVCCVLWAVVAIE